MFEKAGLEAPEDLMKVFKHLYQQIKITDSKGYIDPWRLCITVAVSTDSLSIPLRNECKTTKMAKLPSIVIKQVNSWINISAPYGE